MTDWTPVILSLKVALLAGLLAALIGIPVSRLLARRQFFGKSLIEGLLLLPLVLPPSVTGYGLLILFGKRGPLGQLLAHWGIQVVFTPLAAVIAASVVAFPLLYQNTKAAFSSVDINMEKAARTLGAGELKVFFTVTLPMAAPGVLSGMVLAFTRALGEFGATMMLAGNIPGYTQTIPLAIYFAVEAGRSDTVLYLVLLISLFSYGVIILSNWLAKKERFGYKG